MKYLSRKPFTLPVNTKNMTDVEWEVRMGERCAICRRKTDKCKCPSR